MLKRTLSALGLLVGSALLAAAFAQGFGGGGLPRPDLIKNADSYQPPRLGDYAAKLAQQPDMTGSWSAMQPMGAGVSSK